MIRYFKPHKIQPTWSGKMIDFVRFNLQGDAEFLLADGSLENDRNRMDLKQVQLSKDWMEVPESDALKVWGPKAAVYQPEKDVKPDVLAVQHGGNHYKGMKIQPVEYAKANDLDCLQFSVVKYITRHRLKAGAEDLKKCIHFAQMALKMDYGVDSKVEYLDEKKAGN